MLFLLGSVAGAFVLSLIVFWSLHWHRRSEPVEISLNAVVEVDFHSDPGTLSVGTDCLALFHPSMVRNFYPFGEIKAVAVSHWFESRLVVTWVDGTRLQLTTPWARELRLLIVERLRARAKDGPGAPPLLSPGL